MAQKRVKDMTAISGSVLPDDTLLISRPVPDEDRKVTFANLLGSMGIRPLAFSALPAGYVGGLLYITDGRKLTEGAAAGTGVVVSWDGANWVTADAGTAVAN